MIKVMFWDEDTQHDFMMGDGRLYVPEAMGLVPQLQKLTNFAREKEIPIWGAVDFHRETNREIRGTPDFKKTFPPHCLQGTPGAEKIPVTRPRNPLWIDPHPCPPAELRELLDGHSGEVFFRKEKLDIYSNPNVIPALEIAAPAHLVVYGVALDFCVASAVAGFLKMGKSVVHLVCDATAPIHRREGEKLLKRWQKRGVKLTTTEAVVHGGMLDSLL